VIQYEVRIDKIEYPITGLGCDATDQTAVLWDI
jgi:hypothetical protein